ncbi:putative ribonuclease H-like domain-containing protein [Tanacetum coccineum]
MFTMGVSSTLEATHIESFSDEDEPEANLGNIINSYTVPTIPKTRIYKDHPIDNVIGDVKSTVQTRRMIKPTSEQGFLSDVWILVDLPNEKKAIRTKWVFRNKKDERGIMIRNKARLVAQGHRQEEGFKDPDHPDKVYKVVKALYGLHQAPRAIFLQKVLNAEVNPIIYTSCIEQFWVTSKVQTVNEVRQLQALVDKKRAIISKSSIRRDLHLDDAEGTDCLPTATIFEEQARIGAKSTAWNEFSSSMASLIICLATNQKFNLSKYIFDAMKVQASKEVVAVGFQNHPTDSHFKIPIIDQPSTSSKPKKKQPSKKTQRQKAEVSQDETEHEESVPTPSNHPQPSEEDLEVRKEENVKTYRFEKTQESWRSIADLDRDDDVTLVDETQERHDDELMFDTRVLDADEMLVEAKDDEKDEQSKKEEQSTKPDASTLVKQLPTASVEDMLLLQLLGNHFGSNTKSDQAAKPKVVIIAATNNNNYKTHLEGSSAGAKIEEDKESDELEEVEEDDEDELKKHLLIRADGSSKRYSSMIIMLQGIDREDLEALWRIVKTKYSDIRPEDEFKRVLWGDLKVMFEPDKRSDVWRILQGYMVTYWN